MSSSDPEGSIVSLEGVGYRYPNGTLALEGVDVDFRDSSITAVVGPSGCGKSSLLAVLSGLRSASAGAVKWAERSAGDDRHDVSMMFQTDTVLPWLTVEKNARLSQRYGRRRYDSATFDDTVDQLIEAVGLTQHRRRYPYQLSGGMRRRVAFLTAVAANPRVLLLDEPFSALDEPTRLSIHQSVLDVVRATQTSVVLVTHDLAEAASLADTVVMMKGSPGQVAKCYEVPFGKDRDVMQLRETPEFQQLNAELWHDLRRVIQGEALADGND